MSVTSRFLLFSLLLSALLPLARSADRVVASIPGGVAVTVSDLAEDALRLPPQVQAQALSRPQDVARIAQNILIRRELTRQAEAEGLDKDPKVAATLRAARERVLSEAALARAEGAPPDRQTLERLARNQYDATPEKYDTPEQVRVRHILVSARACEPDVRARELLAQARRPGADFAALAKTNSDDPGSAARGGDLGFFSRGKMAPAFEAAAFALQKPGDLSDVVKTEFGYHVIRLEERKPAGRQPFEAVRDELVKTVTEAETRNRRQQVVEKITANVQFDPEAIDAVVASRPAVQAKPK
jgi:peptidyl-prolyl cis-trans isomerase C